MSSTTQQQLTITREHYRRAQDGFDVVVAAVPEQLWDPCHHSVTFPWPGSSPR